MSQIYTSGKSCDAQKAAAYIAYMMAGSIFTRCRCESSLQEQRLLLHYRELPSARQYRAEERLLAALGRVPADYRRRLGRLACSVTFQSQKVTVQTKEGPRTETHLLVQFYTGFEGLTVTVFPRGSFRIKPLAA